MAKTGLIGPYRLTFDGISNVVVNTMPGVFALGHHDGEGRFCVSRIGRSDTDIGAELRNFIGSESLFKFDILSNSQAAFEKECSLYHDFSPRGNRVHPARPHGSDWKCPHCSVLTRW